MAVTELLGACAVLYHVNHGFLVSLIPTIVTEFRANWKSWVSCMRICFNTADKVSKYVTVTAAP